MCGIVYYKNLLGEPVNHQVIERYKAQRGRGTSGFGFYLPETDRLVHNPRENRILRLLKRETTATDILMHHRFPTSTTNVRNACHPFSTRANGKLFKHQYVLVHNGVLQNDRELQKDHAVLGIEYVSMQDNGRFNDSEALLYDVALYLEGKQTEIKAKGSIAFVVIEKDENGVPIKTHFARNYLNPLKVRRSDGKFLHLASEGDGVDIDPNQLYTFDYATGLVEKKYCLVPCNTWAGWSAQTSTVRTKAHITDHANGKHKSSVGEYYDTTLTRPMAKAPALRGCYYKNGYYDMQGEWNYYKDAMADVELSDLDIAESIRGLDPLDNSSQRQIGFRTSQTEDSEEATFRALTAEYLRYVLDIVDDDYKEALVVTMAALAKKQSEFKKLDVAMQQNEELRNDEEAFAQGFNDLTELDDEIEVMKRARKQLEEATESSIVNDYLASAREHKVIATKKTSKKARRRAVKQLRIEGRKVKVQEGV